MQEAVRSQFGRRSMVGFIVALVAAGLLVAAVFGSTGGAATPGNAEAQQVAALNARLAGAEQNAKFWQQLVQNFKPAKSLELNSMADHQVLVLPSGLVLALHFDSMNLAKAKNLNWVAVGIPARVIKRGGASVNGSHTEMA